MVDGLFAIARAIERHAKAVDGLYEALRSDHPLQGQTLGGIEGALQEIAEALLERKSR